MACFPVKASKTTRNHKEIATLGYFWRLKPGLEAVQGGYKRILEQELDFSYNGITSAELHRA